MNGRLIRIYRRTWLLAESKNAPLGNLRFDSDKLRVLTQWSRSSHVEDSAVFGLAFTVWGFVVS